MKNRVAALLLFSVAVLASFGWIEESLGQTKIPRVGIFTFGPVTNDPTLPQWFEPFRRTLADLGWIEGKNVLFEYPSAQNPPVRYAEAAAELVALKVDVIWVPAAPSVRATFAATRTTSGIDKTSDTKIRAVLTGPSWWCQDFN